MIAKKIVVLIIYILYFQTSSGLETACGLVKGEIIRTLDKSKEYDLRLYIFININSCKICNSNLSVILQNFSKKNVEIVIFLSSITQADAEVEKNNNKWDCHVIGDEFNIYNEYYKVKYQPLLLVLTNEGQVLDYAKLGNDISVNKIKNYIKESKVKKNDFNIYFEEIGRVYIRKDTSYVLSGYHRDMIYNKINNKFYLRNLMKPSLYVINSEGKVEKIISKKNHPSLTGYQSYYNIGWLDSDSTIILYDMQNKMNKNNSNYQRTIQFYNIYSDSLSEAIEFRPHLSGKRNKEGNNIFCLPDIHYFVNSFGQSSYPSNKNFSFSDDDTLIFLYNTDGEYITGFDKPDSTIKKHKVSTWFHHCFGIDDNNNLISIQSFSNLLKFWNTKGELLKVQSLNMGKNFRVIDFDIKDSLSRQDAAEINNKITRTRHTILFDKINKYSLITYENETYPDSVIDPFSDKILIEKYLVISDENGYCITGEPVQIPSSCIPFYFNDSIIIATELDSKKRLQIVTYHLKK
jgi:hypothetical protein